MYNHDRSYIEIFGHGSSTYDEKEDTLVEPNDSHYDVEYHEDTDDNKYTAEVTVTTSK